jgi:GPH family glycoside/pentoside/hexuronide:cation symporter
MKLIFGLGGASENMMQNAVNNMANPVFNLGFGLSPALLGIATAVFRIWDAITDPIMGLISDRTESRLGRRRPYIVVGAVLAGLIFSLLWWCPRDMSSGFYFVWFLVIALLFYSATTVFGVPYLALGFELSPDYHERTRVMAWRTGFASIAGIGIQWLFWLTQRDIFEDTIEGMRFVGMGFGLLMVLMGVAPGLFLKERRLTAGEAAANRANLHARHMFAVLQVRPFRFILAALAAAILGMFTVQVLGLYINIYYVFGGDQKAASMIMGVQGTFYHFCCMASIPAISWVSSRLGKKATLQIFIAIATIATLLKWFLFTPENPWLQFIVTGLMAPGLSAVWTLLASMTADATDIDELEKGVRREGSFGAIYGWTMKLGFAFCFLVAGFILEWTGFDVSLGAGQHEGTILGLRILYSIVPALGLLAAMGFIWKIPFNETIARRVREQLEARKAAETKAGVSQKS